MRGMCWDCWGAASPARHEEGLGWFDLALRSCSIASCSTARYSRQVVHCSLCLYARGAWRRTGGQVSLPEVHRTILVPQTASFWRKLMAFSGPGFLVAVGYMDPGNWATDLAGGARFGYALLSVVMISNLMAILLQHLCIKLGV